MPSLPELPPIHPRNLHQQGLHALLSESIARRQFSDAALIAEQLLATYVTMDQVALTGAMPPRWSGFETAVLEACTLLSEVDSHSRHAAAGQGMMDVSARDGLLRALKTLIPRALHPSHEWLSLELVASQVARGMLTSARDMLGSASAATIRARAARDLAGDGDGKEGVDAVAASMSLQALDFHRSCLLGLANYLQFMRAYYSTTKALQDQVVEEGRERMGGGRGGRGRGSQSHGLPSSSLPSHHHHNPPSHPPPPTTLPLLHHSRAAWREVIKKENAADWHKEAIAALSSCHASPLSPPSSLLTMALAQLLMIAGNAAAASDALQEARVVRPWDGDVAAMQFAVQCMRGGEGGGGGEVEGLVTLVEVGGGGLAAAESLAKMTLSRIHSSSPTLLARSFHALSCHIDVVATPLPIMWRALCSILLVIAHHIVPAPPSMAAMMQMEWITVNERVDDKEWIEAWRVVQEQYRTRRDVWRRIVWPLINDAMTSHATLVACLMGGEVRGIKGEWREYRETVERASRGEEAPRMVRLVQTHGPHKRARIDILPNLHLQL